uniref:Importin beta-1 subunit n=1 Tax=Steinernema glaseri TaxID=37863 RepID=A0A1I8ANW3_9BILA
SAPAIQGESNWSYIIEAEYLKPLVELCYGDDASVAEKAVWPLANITGDECYARVRVIEAGGVDALLHLTSKVATFRVSFVRTISWWFANMCKKLYGPLDVLRTLAQGLAALARYQDAVVRQNVAWAFAYITDGSDQPKILPHEVGALDHLVKAFDEDNCDLILPTLRILCNISAAYYEDTVQIIITKGYLKNHINRLL